MKTRLKTFIVFLVCILYSCTPQQKSTENHYTLNGIIDQDTGIIVLRYAPETFWKFDSTIIKNGKFRFQGELMEPLRATLIKGKEEAELYIEPGVISITIDGANFADYKMSGSKTQAEEELLKEMVKPVYKRLEFWGQRRTTISDSIKSINNEILKGKLQADLTDIDDQWFMARNDLNKAWLKFVLQNPKSYVSPYYLNLLVSNDVLPLDSMNLVFNRLDSAIQKSRYGKIINEVIRKKENIQIGNIAPDFKAKDINNQVITLSEFKEKSVVLLDFWASWCVPCRESIPHLKTLYKKFNSKGFEIISISIDTDKSAWQQAISEEGIDIWFNIPVAEKYSQGPSFITDDDVYSKYDIGAVPTYLLINKEGKIVGHWTGRSDENEKTLEGQIIQLFEK